MRGPGAGRGSGRNRPRRNLPVLDPVDTRAPAPATPAGMDRRHALKIMALAAAAPAVIASGCADEGTPGADADAAGTAGGAAGGPGSMPGSNPKATGTAWDPDLLDPVVSWERELSAEELAGLAVLCDVILPADDRSPAASALGCHDFIDEWVSAPYDGNRRDQVLVRGGLVWLDREGARRFGAGRRFRDLDAAGQRAICDDICSGDDAEPEFRAAARFFDRVRDLTSTAFWTTEEGMNDLGYVGNTPLPRWDAPPPEVLAHLGLA